MHLQSVTFEFTAINLFQTLDDRSHTLLSDHPATRYIIELIMKIILDSFAMAPSRNTQVVEIILDVSEMLSAIG